MSAGIEAHASAIVTGLHVRQSVGERSPEDDEPDRPRGWRWPTRLMIGWTIGMTIWIVLGGINVSHRCARQPFYDKSSCELGGWLGELALVVLWAIVFFALVAV